MSGKAVAFVFRMGFVHRNAKENVGVTMASHNGSIELIEKKIVGHDIINCLPDYHEMVLHSMFSMFCVQ